MNRTKLVAWIGLLSALSASPALAQSGASCHGGQSFGQFLSGLKQKAVAAGVSQRALAEASPSLIYDQGIVNRDRGQRVFGQLFTEFAARMAANYRMQQGQAKIKQHAAAFARTAFESAWLRLHYPAHYLAGLIRAQPMGFYPVEALIHDARRHGVCVEPVCINRSAVDAITEPLAGPLPPITVDPFIVTPSDAERAIAGSQHARSVAVRLGLNMVRGVGSATARRLVAERERGGAFADLDDFARRTALPLSALERLIRAGACDTGIVEPDTAQVRKSSSARLNAGSTVDGNVS